jgi:hypothetical protein
MYGQFNKTTRHLRVALAVVATMGTLAIPTAGHAMDIYGGLSLGQARHETTGGDLLGGGFSGTVNGDHSGGKAFVGLELWDKYVGAEFGYADLGKASAKGTVTGGGSAASSATSEAMAYTASLVGLIPFGSQFGATIRLGFAGEQISVNTTGPIGPGAVNSAHGSDLKLFGGLGAQYYFSKTIGMRLEVDRYNMGSIGSPYINMISAGVVYQFEK